jgi:hypothetical protein
MIKCTISFADLTSNQALTMADDNNCESLKDGPFYDFTAWFDHEVDLENWSGELTNYANNIGASFVTAVVDRS